MKQIKILFLLVLLLSTSAFAFYPEYQEVHSKRQKGQGSYKKFNKYINKQDIKTIFEIGSRDALDAIELSDYYKCHVFAFECNPAAIELCKTNIGLNPNITLVEKGVWLTSGLKDFFQVPEFNIGASSFLEFNPEAPNYSDILSEGLTQKKITVSTVRLDEFLTSNNIQNIDLLCMDVQGAAFEVLQSLGNDIRNVKYIIVELENHEIYKGEKLFNEVDNYLLNNGFKRLTKPIRKLFGDVLYKNKQI
jgi:FkbM family methyltransferase